MDLDQQAGRLQPADHPVCLADATANVKDSEQRRKIAGESSLCCCYNGDDDGPDTCLCRRERQEAQIAAASMEKAREDDEALLDEVDTDDQEQQMEQGETTRTEKEEQQVQPTTAAAHPDPPVASGSGTDNNINNAHCVSEKQNKIVKPLVEINFVNCGSSANLHGAWSQLRNKPKNLSGAAMAAPNQNIGVSLWGLRTYD